jgi:hypothetical protein
MPRVRIASQPMTSPASAAAATPISTASAHGTPPCTIEMPVR